LDHQSRLSKTAARGSLFSTIDLRNPNEIVNLAPKKDHRAG
jgi:hypothetical protein